MSKNDLIKNLREDIEAFGEKNKCMHSGPTEIRWTIPTRENESALIPRRLEIS